MDPSGLRRLAGTWKAPLGMVEKDQAITVALGIVASLPCAGGLAGALMNPTYGAVVTAVPLIRRRPLPCSPDQLSVPIA